MTTTPAPAQGSAPTRAAERNPLGVASLVAGVLLLLWLVLSTTMTAAMPYLVTERGMPLGMITVLRVVPTVLLGLLAVVLGIIALLPRGRRRTSAVIGVTIGASQLLILVAGMAGAALLTAVMH